jgi:hypothetical protein
MAFDFPPPALADLQIYFTDHHAALRCAAALLGGNDAARRADRLSLAVCEARTETRRLRHELNWFIGLLTLRHVDDFDRLEAECFARIDPASPFVEKICLLAEELSSLCDGFGPGAD